MSWLIFRLPVAFCGPTITIFTIPLSHVSCYYPSAHQVSSDFPPSHLLSLLPCPLIHLSFTSWWRLIGTRGHLLSACPSACLLDWCCHFNPFKCLHCPRLPVCQSSHTHLTCSGPGYVWDKHSMTGVRGEWTDWHWQKSYGDSDNHSLATVASR